MRLVILHNFLCHQIAVLFTLNDFLSCNPESWSHCDLHTTWLISGRGSHITRSFTRRNPRTSLSVLQTILSQKKTQEVREKNKGAKLFVHWFAAKNEEMKGEYIFLWWKCIAACWYCGSARMTRLQMPKSLYVFQYILIETILLCHLHANSCMMRPGSERLLSLAVLLRGSLTLLDI